MPGGIDQIADSSKKRPEAKRLRDSELISQARLGDQTAFKQLVERYESQVAATVIGMLGSGPDADEVGQETFVRFYGALGDFRSEAKLGTYLTRIAINLSLDALRRRQRSLKRVWHWQPDEKQPPELAIDTDSSYDRNERRAIVRQAVQGLDPKHRAVVVLRMLQDYSTKETAEILKVPQGTVLSRLSRGLDKLKDRLSPLIDKEEIG